MTARPQHQRMTELLPSEPAQMTLDGSADLMSETPPPPDYRNQFPALFTHPERTTR